MCRGDESKHTHTHTHTHTQRYIHIHTHTCVNAHSLILTHTNTNTPLTHKQRAEWTHTHTHTHTHTLFERQIPLLAGVHRGVNKLRLFVRTAAKANDGPSLRCPLSPLRTSVPEPAALRLAQAQRDRPARHTTDWTPLFPDQPARLKTPPLPSPPRKPAQKGRPTAAAADKTACLSEDLQGHSALRITDNLSTPAGSITHMLMSVVFSLSLSISLSLSLSLPLSLSVFLALEVVYH